MQMRMSQRIEDRVANFTEQFGLVTLAVAGALLVILGLLVINYPELLSWLVGIALVLTGVGALAALVGAAARAPR